MPTYTTAKPKAGNGYALLEPGEYDFEVVDAKETVTKSGNQSIELHLIVNDQHVIDYLVFAEKAYWKIDQFLKAVGAHPGEDKTINVEADDCIGHRGRCLIKVECAQTPKGERRYNTVEHYTI